MAMTAPTPSTMSTKLVLLGIQSPSEGIGMSKGMPTAVADTVIMAPARKQNRMPLARL